MINIDSKLVRELSDKAIKENKSIEVFYYIDYGRFVGKKDITLNAKYAYWNYRDKLKFRVWGCGDISTIEHKDIISITMN